MCGIHSFRGIYWAPAECRPRVHDEGELTVQREAWAVNSKGYLASQEEAPGGMEHTREAPNPTMEEVVRERLQEVMLRQSHKEAGASRAGGEVGRAPQKDGHGVIHGVMSICFPNSMLIFSLIIHCPDCQ